MVRQLFLDYGDHSLMVANSTSTKKKAVDQVYPSDITRFMEKNLPEYMEDILNGKLSEGMFRFPKLDAVHDIEPVALVPFNAIMSLSNNDIAQFRFFHFFQYDYQFNRYWSHPDIYVPFLLKIGQGIGPDFSMYLGMHPAEAIINCCRNRLMVFYMQKKGLVIIPNVCFGDEQTLAWAFDGLPEHSVLALTSQGCMKNNIAKRSLLNGIHELVRKKHPEMLYVYGNFPEQWRDKFDVEIRTLLTFSSKWRRIA